MLARTYRVVSMGKLLFLLFTLIPVLEIWLLIEVGGLVGPMPTIALVLVTGLIGAALAKREGTRVITEWQRALAEGRLPQEGVLSGLLVLVGGVLLVTPGMLTDLVGFSLLLPPTRRVIGAYLKSVLASRIQLQNFATVVPRAHEGAAANLAPDLADETDVVEMTVDEHA